MKKVKVTSSYWAKLKDPRWQRKRLEVMEYHDFACEHCGDTESTLNVHHRAYKKNADPWDYEVDQLACLCEDCHEKTHMLMAMVDEALFEFRTMVPCGNEILLGYLQGKLCVERRPIPIMVLSAEHADGIADGFRQSVRNRKLEYDRGTLLCDLAMENKKSGAGPMVWLSDYRWALVPELVIAELEALLKRNPSALILRCEGEDPGCSQDVAEQFIARAKQALSEVTTG